MQLQEKIYSNAIYGHDPKLLEAIHQKENSIAIFQRDIQSLNKELSIAISKELSYTTSGEVDEITFQNCQRNSQNHSICFKSFIGSIGQLNFVSRIIDAIDGTIQADVISDTRYYISV